MAPHCLCYAALSGLGVLVGRGPRALPWAVVGRTFGAGEVVWAGAGFVL